MPRRVAVRTLCRVERGALARETLDADLRRESLSRLDTDLARELVQGSLRHQESLDHLLAPLLERPLAKADARDRAALRLGAYQIAYLDRVPGRAAVHATVEAVKSCGRGRAAGFVNAVLRRLAGAVTEVGAPAGGAPARRSLPRGDGTVTVFAGDVLPDPADEPLAFLAAAYAHPFWMVERFVAQHGEKAARQVLAAGIARPAVALRPLAGRDEALSAALEEAQIPFEREGRCLLVRGAGTVTALPGWPEGWFVVQDPTAADVAPLLDARPGEGVLELCAAPGGKTVALGEAVSPGGAVLAVDLPGSRLERLRATVTRLGLSHVAVHGADATEPDQLPRGMAGRGRGAGFDAVLVDVPCSNTGVLAQRVEARRRVEGVARIEMLAEQAHHLLLVAASRVRPGGRLVYSTCSVDRAENEDVVAAALDDDPDLELVSERLTLPVPGRRGGGFAAVLRATI